VVSIPAALVVPGGDFFKSRLESLKYDVLSANTNPDSVILMIRAGPGEIPQKESKKNNYFFLWNLVPGRPYY
jgi:hypothetical protein